MKINLLFNIFTFILIINLLAGCGFHARSYRPLPPQLNSLYLDSSQIYGPLEQYIRVSLRQSNIQVVNSATDAKFILKLISQILSQTAVANSASGISTQYNLTLIVTYEILDSKGNIIVPPQKLIATNNYTLNTAQILSSTNQKNAASDSMWQTITALLINQLASTQTQILIEKATTNNAS